MGVLSAALLVLFAACGAVAEVRNEHSQFSDGFLNVSVDWASFLGRADMRWEWDSDNETWPFYWETAGPAPCHVSDRVYALDKGESALQHYTPANSPMRPNPCHTHFFPTRTHLTAWLGNGLHGLSPTVMSSRAIRMEVGRADVYGCGFAPRLPIGYLQLSLLGDMQHGWMNQSIYNAVVDGGVTTTHGEVTFRAWTVSTRPVSVVQWNWSGSEAPQLTFVPELATGRNMFGPDEMNPPAVCSTDEDGQRLCTQHLLCGGNYSTFLHTVASSNSAVSWVSVGMCMPTADQYPPQSGLDSPVEARRNVDEAIQRGWSALWNEHTAWWHDFFSHKEASFLSIPDTRLESFYWIQQAKLGGAMRREGTPITDQQGPYKADLTMADDRDGSTNGSAWEGMWWDWNVEENYWGVARANRLELFGGLLKGLSSPSAHATLLRNAAYLLGEGTEAMALFCSGGLNLVMGDGHGSAHMNTTALKARSLVWKAVPFTAHTIWRACMSSGDAQCRTDLLPLLRGGIAFYLPALFREADGLHMNATEGPPPHSIDVTIDLSLLRWSCVALLDIHHDLRLPRDELTHQCEIVLKDLVDPPTDPISGAVLSARNISSNGSDCEALFAFFPTHTWTLWDHKSSLGASAYLFATSQTTPWANMKNDLFTTMVVGTLAMLGDGDGAYGNLTRFMNTDRHRYDGNGEFLPYGCTKPCLHTHDDKNAFCQPCVCVNTMVEEGGNPILEGGIAMAANLQDFLFNDYLHVIPRRALLVVFPAVPTSWKDAVFHNFRAMGSFLVSAGRVAGRTDWVQIRSELGTACAVQLYDMPTLPPTVSSVPPGASLKATEVVGRYEIEGLPPGGVILLRSSGASPNPTVEPLPANASLVNYYGYRRREW